MMIIEKIKFIVYRKVFFKILCIHMWNDNDTLTDVFVIIKSIWLITGAVYQTCYSSRFFYTIAPNSHIRLVKLLSR